MQACLSSDPMKISCTEVKTSSHALGAICFLDSSVSLSTLPPRLLTLCTGILGHSYEATRVGNTQAFSSGPPVPFSSKQPAVRWSGQG